MGISVHVEFSYNTNTIASSLVGSNPGDAISHTIQTPTHSMAPAQGWHAQFQFNYYPGWRNTATSIHTTQTPLQADENSTGKEPSKQPIQGMAPAQKWHAQFEPGASRMRFWDLRSDKQPPPHYVQHCTAHGLGTRFSSGVRVHIPQTVCIVLQAVTFRDAWVSVLVARWHGIPQRVLRGVSA